MREILFRGKEIYTGEWIYGWYMKTSFGSWPLKHAICDSAKADAGEIRYDEVEPSTVSEFTGFLDITGRRIFEGDICDLSIFGDDHSLVAISMMHGAWGFMPLDPANEHPEDRRWKSFWNDESATEEWVEYLTVVDNVFNRKISLEAIYNEVRKWQIGVYSDADGGTFSINSIEIETTIS